MKMKNCIAIAALVSGVIAAEAQDIVVDSASGNGTMSFWGAKVGTTATVEWAASLTEPGRTNWTTLASVPVTNSTTVTDVPMFFRVRGIPDTNLLNGLIAFFPFTGNAQDQSGNGNNGTVSGQTLTTDRFGVASRAYQFTNEPDYAAISCGSGASLNPTADWTISVRFYATSFGHANFPGILSRRDNTSAPFWELYYNTAGGGGLAFSSSGGGLGTTSSVPLNAWQMVTVTRADSLITMYLNGQTIGQTTNNYVLQSSAPLRIGILGGDYAARDQQFVGKIDDVRLYNRGLSSNEVNRLFTVSD